MRIFERARAVASFGGHGARVVPALRWKRERTPTYKGDGSRDPEEHFENLQVVQILTQPCVLFDDVGSQITGASRRLKAPAITPVLGMVVGRAIKGQKSPVMGWYKELVETESGPLNWVR